MELLRLKERDELLISDIFNFLSDLQNEYSDFKQWFYKKVIPGLTGEERIVYIVKDHNTVAAVLILKNAEEKKICTLRVAKNYRRKGLATWLLQIAFRQLQCAKPIITVSSYHIKEFEPLLRKNGFVPYMKYTNYYKNGISEYAFNGPLNENLLQRFCA